jgi:hypothetical protein
MPKWIVWSPPPIKVLAWGVVLFVVVAGPVMFMLDWLGVGRTLETLLAIVVATLLASLYVGSQRREPQNKQP